MSDSANEDERPTSLIPNYSMYSSKMSKPLPEDTVEKLIKEIRNRPVLWDTDSTEYGVKQLTVMAWYQLQEKLGVPEDVLRYKWKNLRDTFRRECRKKRLKEGEKYTGPWKHFKSLQFLFSRYPTPPEDDEDEDDEGHHGYNDIIQPANVLNIKFEEINANDSEHYSEDYEPVAKMKKFGSNGTGGSYPDEEYDTMFLQSLTPYFRALEPMKKLALRGRILDMLSRELAPVPKF